MNLKVIAVLALGLIALAMLPRSDAQLRYSFKLENGKNVPVQRRNMKDVSITFSLKKLKYILIYQTNK